MLEGADVFLENFSPGAVDRLGFGYEEVKKIKPDIIYIHTSGYGQDGPYRDMKAFDGLIQGRSRHHGDDWSTRIARQDGPFHLRRGDGAFRGPGRDDGPQTARPHGRGPGTGRLDVRLHGEHAGLFPLSLPLTRQEAEPRRGGASLSGALRGLSRQRGETHRRRVRKREHLAAVRRCPRAPRMGGRPTFRDQRRQAREQGRASRTGPADSRHERTRGVAGGFFWKRAFPAGR